MAEPLLVQGHIVIPAHELTWTAARAGGAGGQNVNKVASKVDLRFDVQATAALDEAVKARLLALAKNRLDADGQIVVVSQRTRDQLKNLEDARAKLRALVLQALVPKKPRRATKKTRASERRRLAGKNARGQTKRARTQKDFD